MLNPENRPLRGIYSDEGVGFEHGGPRRFGMLSEANNDTPQYTSSAMMQRKSSFVASNPYASMEAQRNELATRMVSHALPSLQTTTHHQPSVEKVMDSAKARQEYYKRRIEKSRERASKN